MIRALLLVVAVHKPIRSSSSLISAPALVKAISALNCIPVLTCQLHQGLLAQGEHLTSRCQGWTDDLARQRGWAPEGA